MKLYTEQSIKMLGQLHDQVSYGEQKAPLVLLVVEGEGPTLLGRNWLRHIRFDWRKIHLMTKTSASQIEDLLDKPSELFQISLAIPGLLVAIWHLLHLVAHLVAPHLIHPLAIHVVTSIALPAGGTRRKLPDLFTCDGYLSQKFCARKNQTNNPMI